MIDEFFDNIEVHLFNNMATQLDCTVPQCDLGDGGAKWKTPALSEDRPRGFVLRLHLDTSQGVVKTSKVTFSNNLIVIMGLLHIWNRNLKEKIQISNF